MPGFGLPTRTTVDIRDTRPVPWNINRRPLDEGERFFQHSLLYINIHDNCSAREIRIHVPHPKKLFDGTVIVPRIVQDRAIVRGDNQGKRIQLAAALALTERLTDPAPPS